MGALTRLIVDGVALAYPPTRSAAAFTALNDLNLTAETGEFVTLVGPSGCGKTTLLMLIAGLLRPSRGRILLDQRPVTAPGADRALVFQDFALLPWRNVLRNVELGLELQGMPAAERREIARRHIAMVGLRAVERHYPHQLSGGMRQRVGIARALSIDPAVLLMDEPFGALDAQLRQVMAAELLGIWEARRKTVLFVTHDIDEAIYLGDRVLVMSAAPGRIILEVPIDLPRPRPLELRNTAAFTEYRRIIWNLLDGPARQLGGWNRD